MLLLCRHFVICNRPLHGLQPGDKAGTLGSTRVWHHIVAVWGPCARAHPLASWRKWGPLFTVFLEA